MRHGSPLAPVRPDDRPKAYCKECGRTYNPYKHGLDCPECEE